MTMNVIVLSRTRLRGRMRLGGFILALVLAGMLGLAACSARDQLLFDPPHIEMTIVDGPRLGSVAGGTVVTGTAQNTGTMEATNVTAIVTIGGASYSGPVGQSYSDTDGVDNDIAPQESGSFSILVPGGAGGVTAANITFTYTEPDI